MLRTIKNERAYPTALKRAAIKATKGKKALSKRAIAAQFNIHVSTLYKWLQPAKTAVELADEEQARYLKMYSTKTVLANGVTLYRGRVVK
jgi:transposase-like protein